MPDNYLNTEVVGTNLVFDLNYYFVNQTGIDSSSRFISSKKQAEQLKWYSMFTNLPGDMVSFYNVNITSKKIPLYAGIAFLTAGFMITDNQTWKASDKFGAQT